MTDNPDYKATSLGLIPNDWEMVPLREVFEPFTIRLRDYDYGGKPIPILSMTRSQGLVRQSEKFDKRVASENAGNYKIVENGQLVYGFPIDEGVIAILHRYPIGAVSPAYHVWKPTRELDLVFIDYMLKTPVMVNGFMKYASNVVERRRNLSPKDFVKVEIPLPPLPEQRAIAHVLTTVRQSIEATERVIAAARELKRSLMKYLFTYGPVPIDQADQVVLKETEIGEVSVEWDMVRVDDVFKIHLGKMLSGAARKGISPFPYVRNANVQWGFVDITDLAVMDFTENERRKFRLLENDILICEGGEIGRTAIWKNQVPECYYQKAIHRLRPKGVNVIPDFFLYYMFLIFLVLHVPIVQGARSTIAHLPVEKLKIMPLVLPPINVQERIVERLMAIDKKIDSEIRHKVALETLFSSLLHHLMTGKVRVNTLIPDPSPFQGEGSQVPSPLRGEGQGEG